MSRQNGPAERTDDNAAAAAPLHAGNGEKTTDANIMFIEQQQYDQLVIARGRLYTYTTRRDGELQ